jgi:hypothetical protein
MSQDDWRLTTRCKYGIPAKPVVRSNVLMRRQA